MDKNTKQMYYLIQNSTFIENMNKGMAVPFDSSFFGAKTMEGMAYSKDSMYNRKKPHTFHADMTKAQSNYMNPKGTK